MAKKATKSEREHIAKVASISCIVCGVWPVEVHHALTGYGGRRNNMKVLPLCFNHHRGVQGIHTLGRKAWQRQYATEQELLDRLDHALQTV